MILLRAALIRLLQSLMIFLLGCGTLLCLLFSYSFISGDRTDREEMNASVSHVAEASAAVLTHFTGK